MPEITMQRGVWNGREVTIEREHGGLFRDVFACFASGGDVHSPAYTEAMHGFQLMESLKPHKKDMRIELVTVDGEVATNVESVVRYMSDTDDTHVARTVKTWAVKVDDHKKIEVPRFSGDVKPKVMYTIPNEAVYTMLVQLPQYKHWNARGIELAVKFMRAGAADMAEMAENALNPEAGSAMLQAGLDSEMRMLGKRKEMEEIELEERRFALQERRDQLEERRIALRERIPQMRADAAAKMTAVMERLDPDWKLDTVAVSRLKDYVQNGPQAATQQVTVNGFSVPALQALPALSVADVATEMKVRLSKEELLAAGRKMAQLYRVEFGEEPPKTKQLVGGRELLVNAYNSTHREMLEEAVKFVAAPRTRSRRLDEMWGEA